MMSSYVAAIAAIPYTLALAVRKRKTVFNSSFRFKVGFKFVIKIASNIFLLTVLGSIFKISKDKLGSTPGCSVL